MNSITSQGERLVDCMQYEDLCAIQDAVNEIENINNGIGNWNRHNDFIEREYIFGGKSILFQVAKCFDNVVGYVIVRKDENEKDAYLSFLAVNNVLEKSGLGSAILSFAIEKLKEQRFEKLKFHCNPYVLEFYEKFASKNGMSLNSQRFEDDFRVHCTLNLTRG